MSHIQEIELSDGTVVTARVGTPDSYGGDDQDVGFLDVARSKVEDLGELISGVGTSVLSAARAAGPDEAAITFGVEITAKDGLAMAVLARGEAKASLQVTLTWQFDKQRQRDTLSPGPDSPNRPNRPNRPDSPAGPESPDAGSGPGPGAGAGTPAATTGTPTADPAPHD